MLVVCISMSLMFLPREIDSMMKLDHKYLIKIQYRRYNYNYNIIIDALAALGSRPPKGAEIFVHSIKAFE